MTSQQQAVGIAHIEEPPHSARTACGQPMPATPRGTVLLAPCLPCLRAQRIGPAAAASLQPTGGDHTLVDHRSTEVIDARAQQGARSAPTRPAPRGKGLRPSSRAVFVWGWTLIVLGILAIWGAITYVAIHAIRTWWP